MPSPDDPKPDPDASLEWFGKIGAGIMIFSLFVAVSLMVLAIVWLIRWFH